MRKNDQVIVISGDEKGSRGRVLACLANGRVLVEKINMIKKRQKPTQKMPKGGVIEREASLHASNLMVVCGKCNKGVRVGSKTVKDKKHRVCRKCGHNLDHA